ncbi:hypothetical protein AB0K14_33525 [Actinosynnema sp. NPDC050801]|uniref:hypothetical protein n=1 Tax=unclassified Actinosynnema TaxID=2637065 RepID=UPI00340DEE98
MLPTAGTYARAEAVSGASAGDVAWQEVPVPVAGAHRVELTDVVAPADRVWAVGRADDRQPALSWTGDAWTEVAIPVVAAGTRINAAADDGRGDRLGDRAVLQGRQPLLRQLPGHARRSRLITARPGGP